MPIARHRGPKRNSKISAVPLAPPALRVDGLCKRYGAAKALDGLSFELRAGEVLGLLGPNGAGKTTTVEIVAGIVKPDAGAIAFEGEALDRTRRSRVGLALQATALQDKITPREALELFARLYGSSSDIAGLLRQVGLTNRADAHYGRLSGGQKQRVALALALVNDPALLLLDEPTAGLDPVVRADLHRLIRKRAANGCAILLATHDMAEAERLCDRVLVIDRGKTVAEGPPADLVAGERAGTVIEGRAAGPIDPAAMPPLPTLDVLGPEFRCRTAAPARAAAQILAALGRQNVDIVSLRIGPATLEDVILGLNGEREP